MYFSLDEPFLIWYNTSIQHNTHIKTGLLGNLQSIDQE